METKKAEWKKIDDFRDDAIMAGAWELVWDVEEMGDISEDELPPLPEGCDHAWCVGTRWLAA